MRAILLAAALLVGTVPSLAQADGRLGLLIIASIADSRADIVDESTSRTLASLPTGQGPHEVRTDAAGRRAFVVAGRTITVIDVPGRSVRATFDLGSFSAHDVRVSRDGRLLWAACAVAETVLELDAATGAVLRKYSTGRPGAWFVEVTPDEKTLITPNLEGTSVSVITRATGDVKVLPLDYRAYGIDVTPDGRYVLVSGRGVAVVDTSTGTIVRTIQTAEPDTGRLRITPDGKRIVVAMARSITVLDLESGRALQNIPLEAAPKVLTLSRDGLRAYVTNPAAHTAALVDLAAGRVITTLPTGRTPDGIAWAPGR